MQDYLTEVEHELKIGQIHDTTKAIKNRKVLVIGEVIIDEYTYVSGLGKPSKENIISTLYDRSEQFMGGVLPIVNTIAEFSENVELLTLVGSSDIESELVQRHINPEVTSFAFSMPNSVTVRKQRMIDKDFFRKIFEINHVTNIDDSDDNYREIEEWLSTNLKKYDLVLVADFGHGLVRKKTAEIISSEAKFLCINVQTNSYNRGFNLITKYSSANFACIDGPEARLAMTDNASTVENLGSQILEKLHLNGVVVTNGKLGATALNRSGETAFVPAFSLNPVDTMGAGDAFFSLASIYFFESRSLVMACFMGNAHASMQVESVGHGEVVDSALMLKFAKSLLS